MSFSLTNFVQSFFKKEVEDTTVIEVSTDQYIHVPVFCRENCLILYGPTCNDKYDLLLQKPVDRSVTKAISLYRIAESTEAQCLFLSVKDVIIPFVTTIPHMIYNVSLLQQICDLLREYPTFSVAHVAVHLGYHQVLSHPDIIKCLNTAENKYFKTPIHLAIEKKDIRIIKLILLNDVNLLATDCEGNTIFHFAAVTNETIIQLFADKKLNNINDTNSSGKTPLHLACENDKPACVKQLLIIGADVNVAATHESTFPIHAAVKANSMLCTKEIINMYPNQLNIEDMKYGGTPLHWATSKEMANALVDLGCNVNGKNFHGSTAVHNMVQKNNLGCLLSLLSWNADVNITNDEGNTPLHLANSPLILQALLVFGADTSLLNNKGETPLHVIATSDYADKGLLLFYMHSVGAKRCEVPLVSCKEGCSKTGLYNGVPPEIKIDLRERNNLDDFLDDAMNSVSSPIGFGKVKKKGRILCLDGGGMKGLVLIQLLLVLEKFAKKPILSLFDCICGTSTGAILALSLGVGKDPLYCQGLYCRLKDIVFVGGRPYTERPLENILKKEFGESSTMADITGIKVAVTAVQADRFPCDLHFFRNYLSGEDLLNEANGLSFKIKNPPSEQLIWHAARASGAAPTYFNAFNNFIDGGLIANNPTMDFLTDLVERNTIVRVLNSNAEQDSINVVVSLGTGKPPVSEVNIDSFNTEGSFKALKMTLGLSTVAKILVDQATMADNRTVDRARAWCHMCSIPYFRISPQLSLDIALDETSDSVLINMLWETRTFAFSKRNKLEKLLDLLI